MLELILLSAILLFSYLLYRSSSRSAIDVAADLVIEEAEDDAPGESQIVQSITEKKNNQDELFQAGYFTRTAQRDYQQRASRAPFIVGLIVGCLAFTVSAGNLLFAFIAASLGISAGYLWVRRSLFLRKKQLIRDIDFFLPIVMERLVMTAQAGLDVLSGIRVVGELDQESKPEERDPVTQLLDKAHALVERGRGFEESLKLVSEEIESPSLRHSFIYLAVAQKEGGELVHPLRELSDSTHAYFEETVEEDIAKLPVKATLPLLVTFAGLVLFFLTSPIIQIMKLTAESMPQ